MVWPIAAAPKIKCFVHFFFGGGGCVYNETLNFHAFLICVPTINNIVRIVYLHIFRCKIISLFRKHQK